MQAYRLQDGSVLIPLRVRMGDTGVVGDGLQRVAADSPEAAEWARWTVPAAGELQRHADSYPLRVK